MWYYESAHTRTCTHAHTHTHTHTHTKHTILITGFVLIFFALFAYLSVFIVSALLYDDGETQAIWNKQTNTLMVNPLIDQLLNGCNQKNTWCDEGQKLFSQHEINWIELNWIKLVSSNSFCHSSHQKHPKCDTIILTVKLTLANIPND